jgi:hypothetical protein
VEGYRKGVRYGWWVGASALGGVLVGTLYAYLMAVALAYNESSNLDETDQGFGFELAISLITIIPAVLIVAVARWPAAVTVVGAAGALITAVNCAFIVTGGMPDWDGRDIALLPAAVGVLFVLAAVRAWSARQGSGAAKA